MPFPRYAAFALLALVLACGRERTRDGSETAGANAVPLWPEGRGWRFAPEPSAIIGKMEGEAGYQLDQVTSALIVSDSLVVVGDGEARQVRYFSRRGAHLRTVGRNGAGPGEFRWIDWLGTRGDSLLVWDSFAARITILTPGGAVARTIPVALEGNVYPAIGLLGDGSLLLRVRTTPARVTEGAWTESASYIRVSTRDGSIIGRAGPFLLGERYTTPRGRDVLHNWVIFGKRGIIAAGSTGLLTGTSDRLEMTLRQPNGNVLRIIGRPQRRRPATRADMAAEIRQRSDHNELLRADPQMGRLKQEVLTRLPHRDTLPAITRALVDGNGNVWMEEFRIDPDAVGTWSVFDPGGRWLGQVRTPAGVQVMSIGRDAMVGVTRDELDVERVVVYPLLR